MTNSPLTSIIIVAYNCADLIKQCIGSCIAEEGNEVIVIDNASSDDTLMQIAEFGKQIKLIANDKNKGFTQACNQGIKIAKGKYILLLNPDAWLTAGCLSTLSTYLNNNSGVGAIAPMLKYPDGSFQNYTRTFPTVKGLWVENFIPMRWWHKFKAYRSYTCQGIDFSTTQQVEQPAGAALMFRNQWQLDEAYFIYGSDVDLCKTIVNSGYKILQLPEAKVIHHQSKGGTENKHLRLYLDLDNYFGMYYYFKKFKQPFSAIGYRILFGISLFLRAVISIGRYSFTFRWKKFLYFVQNKNFKAVYEQ